MQHAAMIASDDANPDFVGQRDPDRALSVLFYSRPVQNMWETEQQGRPIFSDMDFVKIYLPGDDKTVIDTYAREDHKARFPRQWEHYKNKRSGDQQMIGKTPLSQWPLITAAQAEELRAMKFFAVDDIANASDSALQRINMVAGMSPFAFREKAQRWLAAAAGDAKDSALQAALTEQQNANAAMQNRLAEMEQMLAKMAAANTDADETDDQPEAKRRGRPPKE